MMSFLYMNRCTIRCSLRYMNVRRHSNMFHNNECNYDRHWMNRNKSNRTRHNCSHSRSRILQNRNCDILFRNTVYIVCCKCCSFPMRFPSSCPYSCLSSLRNSLRNNRNRNLRYNWYSPTNNYPDRTHYMLWNRCRYNWCSPNNTRWSTKWNKIPRNSPRK